jgi:hypothetical protein
MIRSRPIAALVSLALFIDLGGFTPVLAAPGVVRGVVTTAGGHPPEGYKVRATLLHEGKVTARTPVQRDGSYAFQDLPDGDYVLELVSARGEVVARNRLIVQAGAESVVNFEEVVVPPGDDKVAPWVWIVAGLGGIGVIALAASGGSDSGGGCDRDTSPSKPGRQCP